jgi:hypothetical protein
VIWSGILHDNGRAVDMQVVQRAWRFVDSHVMSGRYISPPGDFRYWADCWRLNRSNVITYNQGLYALAANFAQKMEVADVTDQTATDAVRQYRMLYRSDLGFLTQSAQGVGRATQDVSALLPEFFYRYFFGDGMLPDRAVTSSVNHYADTAAVRLSDGSLIGIKNIATATGAFADSGNFACPTLRQPGDYHNGGYWPMYTLAGLALAYKIDPKPEYRLAIEQLVARELADGRPKEYWMLSPGNEGMMQPGRADYSWNALVVPLFRWAGLIE